MPWQAELPFALDKTAEGETPRTIALGDRIVPYTLRRARRRTIGLTIDHRVPYARRIDRNDGAARRFFRYLPDHVDRALCNLDVRVDR